MTFPDKEMWDEMWAEQHPFLLRPPGTPKSELLIRMLPWHRRVLYRLKRRWSR